MISVWRDRQSRRYYKNILKHLELTLSVEFIRGIHYSMGRWRHIRWGDDNKKPS